MGYYTPTEKQAALIANLRKEAAEKIAIATEFAAKREAEGKPAAAARIRQSVANLEKAISRDETSIEGGDPSIWITYVLSVINDRWLEPVNR
jgi:hypothetical protein